MPPSPRGAAVAIVERRGRRPTSRRSSSPDVVAALADLARDVVAPRPRVRGDLRIVGITGSNGKTTTKNLLARILEAEGETVVAAAPRSTTRSARR